MRWFGEGEEMPMLLEKHFFKKNNSVSVRQVLQQAPLTLELLLYCSERTEERVEILYR